MTRNEFAVLLAVMFLGFGAGIAALIYRVGR